VAGDGFQFGGRLSLDLTWTLRYRAVAPTELLVAPSDLRRWISTAITTLRGPVDDGHLADAIELREAIHAAARATIDGRPVTSGARSVINDRASAPTPYVQLDRNGSATVRLRADSPVESALAAVAVDAIGLLAAEDGRLRVCEGPACSLLFHDGSRPGRRRWCSTERCGNRVNLAAHRRRAAERAAGPRIDPTT